MWWSSRWIERDLDTCALLQVTHESRLKKRGHSVVSVAVEAYLRSDLSCGSPECRACPAKTPGLPQHAGHYVIPDAEALEDCLDVFELPDLSGFILLTTVLNKACTYCTSFMTTMLALPLKMQVNRYWSLSMRDPSK